MRFLQGQEFHSIILYIFISIQIHYLSSKSNAIWVFHWEPQLFFCSKHFRYISSAFIEVKSRWNCWEEKLDTFFNVHTIQKEKIIVYYCAYTEELQLKQSDYCSFYHTRVYTAKIIALKAQSSISIFAPKLSSWMQTYIFCKMK